MHPGVRYLRTRNPRREVSDRPDYFRRVTDLRRKGLADALSPAGPQAEERVT
jgi:hypothetical protein